MNRSAFLLVYGFWDGHVRCTEIENAGVLVDWNPLKLIKMKERKKESMEKRK